MPERDFEAEFGDMMARNFACNDAELISHFRSRLWGEEDDFPNHGRFVDGLIRFQYELTPDQLRVAKTISLASLIDEVDVGTSKINAKK